MSTEAQIAANQANAQYSTGPKTEAGKAIASRNNVKLGLTGAFMVLAWEKQEDFDGLLDRMTAEHQPSDGFETDLVEKMAQHHWLALRALFFQEGCFNLQNPFLEDDKQLLLYMRYQTTHERAFHKCADELRKLRNEKRKVEIGSESQQQKQAVATHRQANENRKQELHKWKRFARRSRG